MLHSQMWELPVPKWGYPCQTWARWNQEAMRGLPSCTTDLRALIEASSNSNRGLQNCLAAPHVCSHNCFWVDTSISKVSPMNQLAPPLQ